MPALASPNATCSTRSAPPGPSRYVRPGGRAVQLERWERDREQSDLARHAHCEAHGIAVLDARAADFADRLAKLTKHYASAPRLEQVALFPPMLVDGLIDGWPALETWTEERSQTTLVPFLQGINHWNFSLLRGLAPAFAPPADYVRRWNRVRRAQTRAAGRSGSLTGGS